LSMVRSSAWISSIMVLKPLSEESSDSHIIGCTPWLLFLYFWVTLWPLALWLSPFLAFCPGPWTWLFVFSEAWLNLLFSSSFLSCFRNFVSCVPSHTEPSIFHPCPGSPWGCLPDPRPTQSLQGGLGLFLLMAFTTRSLN
jgi:hypothetical protein